MDFIEYHKLKPNDPIVQTIVQNPQMVGLSEADLQGKTPQQRAELIMGEYYLKVARYASKLASQLMFKAQWGYQEPEWFDHRHHLLDLENFFKDYWAIPACEIVAVLPWGGKILELCSGDGFYPYHFYKTRASEIVCVEFDEEVYRHALRCHSAPNIQYNLQSVLDYEPPENYFDVVSIRGAIEHFSEADQFAIFQKAHKALKVGGYFCGDTPVANPDPQHKHLSHHEREYADEAELERELKKIFEWVEAYQVVSQDRKNLFWKAKKMENRSLERSIPNNIAQQQTTFI